VTFDFEEDFEEQEEAGDQDWPDDWLDAEDAEFDDELQLEIGFNTVELLWTALGAIDRGARLTALGWWGLPEALLRAWEPSK
jgi:hypothetical protein